MLDDTPDREPVGQAINAIISALDIVAEMAIDPDHYDEVAARRIPRSGPSRDHAEWLLSQLIKRKAGTSPSTPSSGGCNEAGDRHHVASAAKASAGMAGILSCNGQSARSRQR